MELRAEMVANVWKVLVADGDHVEADDELLVMESMKMEIPVFAPRSGRVSSVSVAEGDVVQEGDALLTLAELA